MLAALDVLVGLSLLGVAATGRRSRRPTLFVVVALAAAITWWAALAVPSLVLAHRPLVAAMIVLATGLGSVGWWGRALVAASLLDVVVPQAAEPTIGIVTAGLALATAARESRAPRPGSHRLSQARRVALVGYAASLALPAVLRSWPAGVEWRLPLLAYLLGMLLVSLVLISGTVASRRVETDAVVELADADPERALRRLEGFLDDETGRADPTPVTTALRLIRENRRLQAELATRVDEVRDSRTRLLAAAVDERRRLAESLDRGAVGYLTELDRCLVEVGADAGESIQDLVVQCRRQVERTLDDLARLARGLHPPTLADEGLAAALTELADRSPLPVDLSVPPGRFGEPAESTLWYACAEALTNAGKHARASRVRVAVTASDRAVTAQVDDDGIGGAELNDDGGLTGLVDRLASVGGRLSVASPAAGGTRITVTVPRS